MCTQIENFGNICCTHKKAENFCASKLRILDIFAHRKNCSCKKDWGFTEQKLPKILHQKAFSDFKGNRSPPYWSKNLKKSLKGTFLENKIVLPQKTKAFFSPLSKIGEFRELKKKAFLSGQTPSSISLDLPKFSLSHIKGNLRSTAPVS